MIKTSEQAKAMVAKGMKSPNHGKRGPAKTTIAREQVMREHAEKNLSHVLEMTDIQLELARIKMGKKKPNAKIADVKLKASETIIRRALGNPVQQTDITSGGLPIPILSGLMEDEN